MTDVSTGTSPADEFFNVGFFADVHRNVDDIEELRSIIGKDLHVEGIDPKDEVWRGFLTDVCLAIRYYSRKLKVAMLKRVLYVARSIALIVVIPLTVHLLSGAAQNQLSPCYLAMDQFAVRLPQFPASFLQIPYFDS